MLPAGQENPTILRINMFKYLIVVVLLTLSYLSGYNKGIEDGTNQAIQYDPRCKK